MNVGQIVEFVFNSSETKYYARIDGWFLDNGINPGGGIDSNLWFIKERSKKGWHKGTGGYFPLCQCRSVKLCTNKSRLAMFL